MKKSILLLFAALLPLVASAQTKVEIDGIWYNLDVNAKQAEVTYKGDSYDSYSNEYSGSITLPATVTYYGVAYSVTSIGDDAFKYCTILTSIILPEGVTSIGYDAFEECSSLTAIYCYSEEAPLAENAFGGLDLSRITLHVPKSALEAYKNTEPWSQFGAIEVIK